MGITHIAVDLRLGHQGRHRVHDHDIHRAGANHCLCDLQGLLAVIRLGDIEVVNIHADILRVNGIQGMLRINKAGNASPLLYLRHHMKGNGGLTAGLRTVNLDHTSLGDTSQSQGNIQAQGTGGHCLDIHICSGISQLHHRALSVGFFDLGQRRVQGF